MLSYVIPTLRPQLAPPLGRYRRALIDPAPKDDLTYPQILECSRRHRQLCKVKCSSFPFTSHLFNLPELNSLAIPLSDNLPMPNARKTCVCCPADLTPAHPPSQTTTSARRRTHQDHPRPLCPRSRIILGPCMTTTAITMTIRGTCPSSAGTPPMRRLWGLICRLSLAR